MSRYLLQLATDTQPLHEHHAQRPFHLNTAASVVIVFCGLGASISFMGAVALYFWCFKRPRSAGQGGGGSQGEERYLPPGDQPENRSQREKISRRIVEQLPVMTSFGTPAHDCSDPSEDSENKTSSRRRSADCCSVCLTEFVNGGEEEVEDGLRVRRLPECGHCFHTECIQLWLCSYLSCPLCRSSLVNLVSGEEASSEQSSQVAVVHHESQATTTLAADHVALEIDGNPVGVEMRRNNSVRSGTPDLGGSGSQGLHKQFNLSSITTT